MTTQTKAPEPAPDLSVAALQARFAAARDPHAALAELLVAIHARIARIDDPGIFITLRDRADLAAEAMALPPFDPARYPLWGVPFAVKDNIDVAGLPTTAACPAFTYVPAADAVAVARLRAAGALVLGKTNLDQFATGLVGVRTPYPVPRNALDAAIVPGGSSSGSAVAVAQGIAGFALGTDTAGSGRVPAALNRIVGLKPSLGLLSGRGMVPACRTLDTISIFAAGVADAVAVLRVAAAPDPQDPYSRAFPALRIAAPERPAIGVPDAAGRQFFGDTLQAAAFAAAVDRLRALGARVTEIDMTPFHEVAALLYDGPWVAERMAAVGPQFEAVPDRLHPVTRRVIGAAGRMSAVDAFEGQYRLAELKLKTAAAMSGLDLLCVPSIPTFYSRADLEDDPVEPNSRLGTYTNFVNLLDMAALAVPTAGRADGRPGSVTLIGAAGSDGMLAALAGRIEADAHQPAGATGRVPPPLRPQPLPPAEVVVAAVGAHMTGLPLNHELTDLGARCLGPAMTAPAYRLYALAGGPVPKPGMIRVAEDGGVLELELWSVPLERFGSFVAGVPRPLSIGTVELADGRLVKGFLAEPEGLSGARDITQFGGWRAYLAGRQAARAQVPAAGA